MSSFSFLLSLYSPIEPNSKRLSRILSSSYRIRIHTPPPPISSPFDLMDVNCVTIVRKTPGSAARRSNFKKGQNQKKKRENKKVLHRHDSIRNDVNNNRNKTFENVKYLVLFIHYQYINCLFFSSLSDILFSAPISCGCKIK